MPFDTTQQIDLTITAPDGDKRVTVSYPSDEQLIERSRKMKLVSRSLGRGKSRTETEPDYAADLALFNTIKVSGDDLDEYEAAQVISRLVRCTVEDSRRDGNRFVVILKVPGAKTTHTLKIPTAKQTSEYSRAAVSVIEGRHGLQEMRLNPHASMELYDKLLDTAAGYAGAVPQPHKEVVISEIMALLNSIQDGSDDEGF